MHKRVSTEITLATGTATMMIVRDVLLFPCEEMLVVDVGGATGSKFSVDL